jgi:APA family basic amino acid/polyamine antiporter
VFLRESFGGLPAFLSGWISLLVGFSAPIAAAAMACAAYFWAAWGGTPGTGLSWQIHGVTVLTLSPVTLTAGAVILGFSLVHRHSLAPREMRGVLEVGEKAALALFGPWLSHFIAGAIALSLLSLISAMLMTGPRVYQAMARDGLFFTGLSRAGGPYGTPGNAIFLQAALALLMVFTASFENLLIFIGFTLSLFSLLTVAGLMVLRRRQPRPDLPYRTLGYPLTPLFFILCNAWIIIFSLINKPAVSLVGLAAILAGLLLYGFFRRRAVSSQ